MEGVNYLVKNGKTEYELLVSKTATKTELQAVKELSEYIKLVSDVSIKTVNVATGGKYISIGRTQLLKDAKLNTDYKSLNDDGFVIKTVLGNVITDANTDRGFLYATYEIIEKVLGVRFLTADETYIKKASEIVLPNFDLVSVPAFRMRTYLNYSTYPHKTRKSLDIPFASHTRDLSNWYDFPEEYGGKTNTFSRVQGTHNSRFYIPASKYLPKEVVYDGGYDDDWEPHPELYFFKPNETPNHVKGTGMTINWLSGITPDGKLDKSQKISAVKIVIEELKKDVLANPYAKFFVIDQEDIHLIMPNDDETVKKYTPAGVVIRFLNVVATEIKKWANATLGNREVNIVTFAYQQTMHAPAVKNEKGEWKPIDKTVIPVDNLYIRLAYMSFHYYPYGDYRQPEEVLRMTYAWKSVCNHFWFWGYDAIFNDYFVYNPTIGQIKGTVTLMKEMGVDYFIMLASYDARYDWQSNIKGYAWAKLLWDITLDERELIDEFINLYYGRSATCVKEVMSILDKRYDEVVASLEVGHDEYNCYKEIGQPKNISVELLVSALNALRRGEEDVKTSDLSNDEKQKLLTKLARISLTLKWMQVKYFDDFYPDKTNEQKISAIKEVYQLANACGCTRIAEGKEFADYIKEQFSLEV